MAAVNAVCHRRSPRDTAVPLPTPMQRANRPQRRHFAGAGDRRGTCIATRHVRPPGGIADEDGRRGDLANETTIRAGRARARARGRSGEPGLGRAMLHRLRGRQADVHGGGADGSCVLPCLVSRRRLVGVVPRELPHGGRDVAPDVPHRPHRLPDGVPDTVPLHGRLRRADGHLHAGRAGDREGVRAGLPRERPVRRRGLPRNG